MAYKGFYKIKNIEKYSGDPTKVIYRSLWERKFMIFCDTNSNVINWSSEEIVIPYYSIIDERYHRYYVDFWVKIRSKRGIEEYLIEIKPLQQCKPPKIKNPNKISKKELNEIKKWNINKQKWKSALNYANERNLKY
jgi:hypothetical protein